MMKMRILAVIFSVVFYPSWVLAQCGVSGSVLNIESEAELDALAPCDSIFGSLVVEVNTMSNITALANLEYVEQDFVIEENLSLLNMQGLNNLSYVGGDFAIRSNFTLINLNGLDQLDSVGGDLFLEANLGLDNMTGMEALRYIGGDLHLIDGNLDNLDGLEQLEFVGGDVLLFEDMSQLEEIQALGQLDTIQGSLLLNEVAFTSTEGLENLDFIGGNLEVRENVLITNLNGLGSLAEIGGDLIIDGNFTLTQVDSLKNLGQVGGSVAITNNFALNNCCGIEPLLPLEIDSIQGSLTLSNNGVNCNEESVILDLCAVGIEDPEEEPWIVVLRDRLINRSDLSLQVLCYDALGKIVDQSLLFPQDVYLVPKGAQVLLFRNPTGVFQSVKWTQR